MTGQIISWPIDLNDLRTDIITRGSEILLPKQLQWPDNELLLPDRLWWPGQEAANVDGVAGLVPHTTAHWSLQERCVNIWSSYFCSHLVFKIRVCKWSNDNR